MDIRERCQRYFTELVPNHHADLIYNGFYLSDGLKFTLIDAPIKLKQSNSKLNDLNNNDVLLQRNISTLSGGQKALLGISFVFASALSKHSPLYLLDEIDAALDETNQHIIGKIIRNIFNNYQVLCISHHNDFQKQALNKIPIIMKNGNTILDININ